MRAAVLEEHGEPLAVKDVDYPEPEPDQVVVETEACGVCRSDWHAWQGDWNWIGAGVPEGQILGHEPAGVVSEVGSEVETLEAGDRVAVPFHLGDGTCPHCREGRANNCETVLPLGLSEFSQGAFAEAFAVREADFNCVKLPDEVDYDEMAGLGCRFMTAYHALADRADLRPGDWVAVHGCGGVGLSAIHIADALGAHPIAIDLVDDKLERAEELGARETVNVTEVDSSAQAVQEITDGGADVSIDALGVADTCKNSVNSLGTRGSHVQVGLTTGEEEGQIELPVDVMTMQEIDFHGSFGMPLVRYEELFKLIAQGTLEPSKIIGERLSLDELPETLASMDDYETVGIPVVTEF
ncbi:zinc-dependent alcohol dehydrogenase family protein [Natrinema thermotolerans]|uniref:Zinc-dependent alcohol dehydrogenase family protein n=1 Tax=Natrinema thermotolerans TaxID=121872 RepID=A0AAF0PET1_9EURY|nr:zinc-dependent alcohol dehydrogenase family protein [Natrinema thermotolerans]QCC60337.1 alcohol dehydrogenase [Natrinema thermotolerans]QCC61244.1 alcohol dehydrogenase [Natrinema thermotolerans]WMT07363.1 zinc-dependent alcohol dehydrogenase family protein [Natrinema thermotolerans]